MVGPLGPAPGHFTTEVVGAELFELGTARDSKAWEPQIGSTALETMSEMGAQGSETSSELAERVTAIAEALSEAGHSAKEVALAMKVEFAKNEDGR